jgi:hypothetical protein
MPEFAARVTLVTGAGRRIGIGCASLPGCSPPAHP